MFRPILVVLISFVSLSSQTPIADVLFPSTSSIQVQKYEPVSKENGRDLLDLIESLDEERVEYEAFIDRYSENPVHGAFHEVDVFKDDYDKDIILYGHFGEERIIRIWHNTIPGVYSAGEFQGFILKMYRETPESPFSFVISSGYCCGNEFGDISLVQANYVRVNDPHGMKYKYEVRSVIKAPRIDSLDIQMIEPIKFKVSNNDYNLRSSPKIENDPIKLGDEIIRGNITATYPSNSTGTALGKQIDVTGRVWWFVVMEVVDDSSYNRFTDDAGKKKCGWMSSRYLKAVE